MKVPNTPAGWTSYGYFDHDEDVPDNAHGIHLEGPDQSHMFDVTEMDTGELRVEALDRDTLFDPVDAIRGFSIRVAVYQDEKEMIFPADVDRDLQWWLDLTEMRDLRTILHGICVSRETPEVGVSTE